VCKASGHNSCPPRSPQASGLDRYLPFANVSVTSVVTMAVAPEVRTIQRSCSPFALPLARGVFAFNSPRCAEVRKKVGWLPNQDSNLDKQIQRLLISPLFLRNPSPVTFKGQNCLPKGLACDRRRQTRGEDLLIHAKLP
jgi:hypothetical protein